MIAGLADSEKAGELIRPVRFLPYVDWNYQHTSFAYGPPEIESAIASPDMGSGNYNTQWVAYVDAAGDSYLVRKLTNGLWSENHISLISLSNGVQKVSLEFSPDGRPLLGYVQPDDSMGIWWVDPISGLPQLLPLATGVQDILMNVENKDDPAGTDVFLWYFVSGSLFLRKYSEHFATEHGPFVSGVSNPVILQAGMNHRYGYQIDYRSQV